MKIKIMVILTVILDANIYSQNISTVLREEYIDVVDDDIMTDDYAKKTITAKLFDQINLITNDSTSFVKLQFSDENKVNNNGYVFLSNHKELDSFISDLKNAIECSNYFESKIGKYQIIANIKVTPRKTKKTISIYETIGGSAYIFLNIEASKKLLNWLSNLKF
jgi:hypothetical protein